MNASGHLLAARLQHRQMLAALRLLGNVCKLRIGVTIAYTSLAGVAITAGTALHGWQIVALGLAVLLSSACAGGFNQYMERDLDARMRRTCGRPFVTGQLRHTPLWLYAMLLVLLSSVAVAWLATNAMAALYVFLGAFFYGVVYTMWLKRRTWLNIVVGGLAGSFAVLAGAAAVAPIPGVLAWLFAVILFLWTPSHFWSLAIALHEDYAAARVPMLPVVIGNARAARIVLANTVVLVSVSILPVFYGLGWVYLTGALVGGGLFLVKNVRMVRDPSRHVAMASFHASLAHLTLLLTAAIIDAQFLAGW